MAEVIAIGELLIDFAGIGTDCEGYPTLKAQPGGAPANYLAPLAKYGVSTAFIGKVGNDSFGRMLVKTLNNAGIDTSNTVLDDSYFTTLAFVTWDKNGDREFSFARKPGADTQLRFEEINLGMIDSCRVFHFGTLSLTDEPSRSATLGAVNYAKEQSKIISFDPNYRAPLWENEDEAKKQIKKGLELADVVKISDEEVDFVFGTTPEEGADIILNHFGAKLVFVTLGSNGCFYSNGKASGYVPGLTGVKAVDTTGAGDIFGGSAMYGLLKTNKAPEVLNNEELGRIAAFAVNVSGVSVTRLGGIPSVPELSEIATIT